MPMGKSYPRQLERILNERARRRGDPTHYEVINAGVIGYATEQEAAYLRVEGGRFDPDLVLLAYYPVNDTHPKQGKYERYQRLRSIHPWLLEVYTAPRHLYISQFIKGVRRAAKRRWGEAQYALGRALSWDDPRPAHVIADDWTRDYAKGGGRWLATRDAIIAIGEATRGNGAGGLVMLLPDVQDLAGYEDRAHPKIGPLVREAVAAAQLDWLDLLDAFRSYRGVNNDEIQWNGWRHPNQAGYLLIAEAAAREIERRYLGVGGEPAETVPGLTPASGAAR